MTKREAKRIALGFAADLLRAQDGEGFLTEGYSEQEVWKIESALAEIARELDRRSKRNGMRDDRQ